MNAADIEELKSNIRKLHDRAIDDQMDASLLSTVRAEGRAYAYRTVLELLEAYE